MPGADEPGQREARPHLPAHRRIARVAPQRAIQLFGGRRKSVLLAPCLRRTLKEGTSGAFIEL
jgi:hypothetical protein